MDIPQLAAKVVEVLTPFITAGATAAASEMGTQAVIALWEKLKPKMKEKESARDAMEFLREEPENPSAKDSLERQVRKILVENPELAAEVGQIIQDSVVIHGNISGDHITIGNDITIIYGDKTPPPSVSVEQLTLEYLQALAAECEKLPLGAIHVTLEQEEHEASISLEDIYIDLEVRPRLRRKDAMSMRGKAEAIPDNIQEEREPQRIPILEALAEEDLRRVVLLGEAGSGKTTCVHYLTIALADIQQKVTAKKPLPEGSALAQYFPIRLILRDVAGYISPDIKKDGVDILWNALRGDLNKKVGEKQAEQLFPHLQKIIKTKPCLIMLDGLDEVPESEERRPRLLEAIEHFAAPLKQSIVMVTARPYAYDNPKWHLPHFEIVDLLDFSSEQIQNFISNFYDSVRVVRNWDDALTEAMKSDLNEAVQGREYLYKLAERPLLLTLIASVDSSGNKLPDDRAELYKQTIDLMLQRWQKRKENSLAENEIVKFFSTDAGRVIDILQRLAYKVHERQGRDSKRKADAPADIDRDEVWGAFSSALPKEVDTDALLNFLEKRAGLLLDRGEGVYVFPHRSFQEYLAAGFLNTQSDEKYHLDKIFRGEPAWWREVVLLGIARMSGSLKNAADEVNNLVPCEIGGLEREITPTDWQAAALAGQALLEMRLKEKGGDQVKYKTLIKRVTNWLAQLLEQNALSPRERADAGNTLARLGDPRIGVALSVVEGHERLSLLLCEIPAGKFMMGSKDDEEGAYDDERPQFEYNIPYNYFMSRYPITNAQFDLFVKDPNGYTNNAWWTEAVLEWHKDRKEPDKAGGVFDLSNHPAVYLRWYEMVAFTRWATHQLDLGALKLHIWKNGKIEQMQSGKYEVRLPTEAEWERAARGGRENQPYPWGNKITLNHANYADTQLGATSAVGAFPAGMNDYGLLDMSGNVWEWCATESQDNYAEYLKKENNKTEGDSLRVLRGGSFNINVRGVRCAYRGRYFPLDGDLNLGFRAVVSHFS